MFCRFCGNTIPANSQFCPSCGKSTQERMIIKDRFSTLDKPQKIMFWSSVIWFVLVLFIGILVWILEDEDYGKIVSLLAIVVPVLFWAVLNISKLSKREKNLKRLTSRPLDKYLENYDGARIDTVFNKITNTSEKYFVFTKETRALLREPISNLDAEDIKKIQKELVVKQEKGVLVIDKE